MVAARRVALPVLPVAVDAERRDRGVSLDDWCAAPPPPATRDECEHSARPCPALRCTYHVGLRGDGSFSCQWDFVEQVPAAERTWDRIAAVTGLLRPALIRTFDRVVERNKRDNGDVPPEQKLAQELGLIRRPRGQRY